MTKEEAIKVVIAWWPGKDPDSAIAWALEYDYRKLIAISKTSCAQLQPKYVQAAEAYRILQKDVDTKVAV